MYQLPVGLVRRRRSRRFRKRLAHVMHMTRTKGRGVGGGVVVVGGLVSSGVSETLQNRRIRTASVLSGLGAIRLSL